MKLFNTESRVKEEIVSVKNQPLKIYTCGPTVYDYAHIGNFRTYVVEDLLRRTLKFFKFQLIQVMNITDIDDKTLRGALEQQVSLKAFTDPFIQAFFDDLQILNIEKVEHYPRATDYIPDMIKMIEGLLNEGIAYRDNDGSIYYNIDKCPSYGKLSHLPLHQLRTKEKQVIIDEYHKDQCADFALWKGFDPKRDGEVFWEAPFGKGRPGWHIECSSMALSLLGKTIDIHAGGVDNMFPHHENEIAQSESFTKQKFVRHWLHVEHLMVNHQKMSKSLGNFFTLRDLVKMGYSGSQVRYLLLQTHYRTPLNFTLESLQGAANALERLENFILRLKKIDKGGDESRTGEEVQPALKKMVVLFSEALADDLNISVALAALFELVRDINALCDENKVGEMGAQTILKYLEEVDQVLGILPLIPSSHFLSSKLKELLSLRQKARESGKWSLADSCRNQIFTEGYFIEDTPTGPRLKKRRPHDE